MGDLVDCEFDSGDTAWVLISTGLVMIQTPAIGFTQAGMIRRKNSLSMLLQVMVGMAIGSILWFIVGFTITFGPSHFGFIGSGKYAFLVAADPTKCLAAAPTIPSLVYILYQMMFALMVPVIVTGAWAEKMNFRAFVCFTILWPFFCYYTLAHWVWAIGGWMYNLGVIDFAGGITIHTNAGIAGLVVALVMGRNRLRIEKSELQDSHHNIPLTIIGGALIWMGWFGFNGGSALAGNGIAGLANMNTHIAACTSAFMWMVLAFVQDKHYHLSEFMNGAFAGLAGITPGAGFVLPYSAFCIGIVVGVASFYSVQFLRNRVQLDDVLDVVSLQGTPGIIGSLAVGCLATTKSGNVIDGMFYGNPIQLLWQLIGVSVAIVNSAVFTFLIIKGLEYTIGIHITTDVHLRGLDAHEVGEKAYDQEAAQPQPGDGNIQKRKKKNKGNSEYVANVPENPNSKGALTFGAHPVSPKYR